MQGLNRTQGMRPAGGVARTVFADQVYEILKERILDERHAPGDRLNVDRLGRELGVSSSPIREALTRLSGEGLVVNAPFVGFSVAPVPEPAYFRAMFDVRMLLEPAAVATVAAGRDPALVAAVTDAQRAMDGARLGQAYADARAFHMADQAFHLAIVDAASNPVLSRIYRDLAPHQHHARLYIRTEQDTDELRSEHKRILDALVDGDADAAADAMRAHIAATCRRLTGSPPTALVTPTSDGAGR